MFCLNHDHPDIIEFLDAKLNRQQIQNANISVVFMNESPASFFDKVKADADHDLVWQGKVIRTIKARELWDRLLANALQNGEPGILNGHLANEMNNIHYCRKLTSTNPCGEIFMQPYSVCCLGALVLTRFIRPGKTLDKRVDWEALHASVSRAVRFLDNVLSVNHYPLKETEVESLATRRIGLGVMGLHDMLLTLGLRYSSQEARDFVEKIMSFIKHTAYDMSTYLAVEKGPFPEFVAEEFLKSGFAKTLKPSIRNKIRTHGMRNCALLTIAPTGTTSIVQGVTSGIEPLFATAVAEGSDVSHFEGSDDVHPRDHFAMQAACQRHVDNAISKTVNIPQDKYTPEMLGELYMEFVPVLKGTTIYPVGSRDNTPLEPYSLEKAYAIARTAKVEDEQVDTCVSGVCGI
jgi:ribonucleoside-diphosphate reductase alpha chain